MNSEYNISSKTDSINYRVGSGAVVTTSPLLHATYTIATLLTAVNSLISDLSGSLTTDGTQVILWSNVGASDITLQFDSKMSKSLGLTSDLIVQAGGTERSQSIPDLIGLQIAHLSSRTLSHSNSVTSDDSNSAILSSITVDKPFGALVAYSTDHQSSDNIIYHTKNSLDSIDIEILDENMERTELMTDISLVFKVLG
jgi:hypothetical protein